MFSFDLWSYPAPFRDQTVVIGAALLVIAVLILLHKLKWRGQALKGATRAVAAIICGVLGILILVYGLFIEQGLW